MIEQSTRQAPARPINAVSLVAGSALFVPVALTFLGLALRLWCLDCNGLWSDEVVSIEAAQRGVRAILTDNFGWMLNQTPLYYLLVWLTAKPIDPATTSVLVRMPSVLAGAVTPLVVYLLGRELFGRFQGLFAALLVAISAVHIGHSQDARPYAFYLLFATLSVYTLVMAERIGSGRWWAGFVLSTAAGLYMMYLAATIAMPSIAPYIAWVLVRAWQRRREQPRAFRYALLSLAGIAVLAIPVLLGILQVPKPSPNLQALTFNLLVAQVSRLLSHTGQIGIGGTVEPAVEWGYFGLSMIGLTGAVVLRRWRGLALCLLMIIVPCIVLAVLRTSNVIFQRYALVSMPFYFLLMGQGLNFLWSAVPERWLRVRDTARGFTLAAAVAVGAFFLVGLYIYFSPQEHYRVAISPDYRGVAQYLSRVAKPGDLIILADEPNLGLTVVSFYWKGKPPAPTYDARDPRLFKQQPSGSIYWVVSYLQSSNPGFQDQLAARPEWAGSERLERVVVLKESGPVDVLPSMERMVSFLQSGLVGYQPTSTLQAGVYEATGDWQKAAGIYRAEPVYFPQLGEEYLHTAQGFDARGDEAKAWREALISKFMQPSNPAIHRWFAARLAADGYPAEARVEEQIASAMEK